MRFLFLALLLAGATSVRAQVTALNESFDQLEIPALPTGWSSSSEDWSTSASSESTGSGANNLAHGGTGESTLTLPAVDLGAASAATLHYLARRTSSYPADSLQLEVSGDAGTSWSLLGASAALPSETSTWAPIEIALPEAALTPGAVLRFLAFGGSTGGSNIRLDDIRIEYEADVEATTGTLGFFAPTVVVPADSAAMAPVRLRIDEGTRLQGVQFTVSWSGAVSPTNFGRGGAVEDLQGWSVDSHVVDSTANVVVLSTGSASLGAESSDSLLTIHFSTGGAGLAQLAIADVIAAASDPEGSTVWFDLVNATLTLDLQAPSAGWVAPDSLDFGQTSPSVPVELELQISNPSQEPAALTLTTSSSRWSVSETSVALEPGQTASPTVTFSPDSSDRGTVTGQLTLTDEAGNVRTVALRARVEEIRGDADGDGAVDVLDVVLGIDHVLGRSPLPAEREGRLDLHPFPEGDGQIDVRDLAVVIRAIVDGVWPDAGAVSARALASAEANKKPAIYLYLIREGAERQLIAEIQESVRAVQAELTAIRPGAVVKGFSSVQGSVWAAARSDQASFIWLSMDGAALPAGRHLLGRWPLAENPFPASPQIRGVAIDQRGSRSPVFSGPPPSLQPDDVPFPNPFRIGHHHSLRWNSGGGAAWEVFDLLGRRVGTFEGGWDGRDRSGGWAAPGIYMVRLRGGSMSHPISVIR